MMENEKKKRNKQLAKKTHLATWGDKDIESRDEKEKEEDAVLCLMAMEDERVDVNDINSNSLNDFDDDVDDLYNELYDGPIKTKKNVNFSKRVIANLEIHIDVLQKRK